MASALSSSPAFICVLASAIMRIDQRLRVVPRFEDAGGRLELLDRFREAPAPEMQDAGEHVDQAGDVLAAPLGPAPPRAFSIKASMLGISPSLN